MALLLCQGLGNLCSGICEGLSHICTLPCRICCSGCRFASDSLCQALTSPFFPYLAVTCALNLPPSVWGLQALVRGCSITWLTVNAVLTAIHIAAAFYIVTKIQAENWDDDAVVIGKVPGGDVEKGSTTYQRVTETRTVSSPAGVGRSVTSFLTMSSSSSDSRANSISRLIQVICYDAGVAIYILVFCFWTIWLSMGAAHLLGGGSHNMDYDDSCDAAGKWVRNSVIIGWCYMMLVCCSFCCSLVCIRP